MCPTVSAYIESVLNSADRFRSLKHVFPEIDNVGEPKFTTNERSVTFRTKWRDRSYLMSCPFSLSAEEQMRIAEACTEIETRGNPYITPMTFRKNELLVFVTDFKCEWKDVLMQEHPTGRNLFNFISSHIESRHSEPFRKLLGELYCLADSFATGGFVHGSLTPYNIFVRDDCSLVTVNYRMGRSCNPVADRLSLARTAVMVYLLGSDKRMWHSFKQINAFTAPISLQTLRYVIVQAEAASLPALKSTVRAIADIDSYNWSEVAALIDKLSREPFHSMDILGDMLISETEAQSNLRPRRHPKPPSGETEAADISPRIEFSKCSWVGHACDMIIRFKYCDRWGFADRYGSKLTPELFLSAEDFYEGRARVETENGFGLIDRNGKYVMQPCYEDLVWHGQYNVVTAVCDGRWHMYDRSGCRLTPMHYDWMGECSEGFVPARRGMNYGFLRPDGSRLSDFRYDEAFSFRDGKALVSYNGNRYHIDEKGCKIVRPGPEKNEPVLDTQDAAR